MTPHQIGQNVVGAAGVVLAGVSPYSHADFAMKLVAFVLGVAVSVSVFWLNIEGIRNKRRERLGQKEKQK